MVFVPEQVIFVDNNTIENEECTQSIYFCFNGFGLENALSIWYHFPDPAVIRITRF